MKAFTAEAFGELAAQGAVIIDTRSIELVRQGFIKGSLAMGTYKKFKEYLRLFAGYTVDSGFTPVLLVLDELEKDTWIDQLQKSHDNIQGYLAGGFDAWQQAEGAIDMIIDVEPDELIMDIPFDENLVVIDIRPAITFGGGHLKDAVNLPLTDLVDTLRLSAIEDKDNLYLVGDSDEDSFLAATILKKQDIHNLRVVTGGWDAVQKEKKAEIVKEPGLLN
ncbi:MAG: rhodanese-like domain-containing protein [Niabella sp.]